MEAKRPGYAEYSETVDIRNPFYSFEQYEEELFLAENNENWADFKANHIWHLVDDDKVPIIEYDQWFYGFSIYDDLMIKMNQKD